MYPQEALLPLPPSGAAVLPLAIAGVILLLTGVLLVRGSYPRRRGSRQD